MFLPLVVDYGVVGYVVIEGFNFLDALYMTVTTLATVGFGEVHPLSPAGRVFTISLIVFGIVGFFDLVGRVTTLLASGELVASAKRRNMRRRIEALRDHYVVCAYGRVGRAAVQELMSQGAPVIALDVKQELEPALEEAGIPYLIGDPSEEAVLKEAGIERARGLVCAVDSDAVNVYITLTARALNPGVFIVARASSPESVDRLRRAGADRIVSPYVVSGVRMASLALRPAVVEFVDMVTVAPDLRVEEIVIRPGSRLAARTVSEACSPHANVTILALKKPGGGLEISPRYDVVLSEGDLLIALGPIADLSRMAERAG